MMQDEELIRLYVTRSERAIALTSDKYGGYCHTIAYQILKDLEDSEECVNDTYWKASLKTDCTVRIFQHPLPFSECLPGMGYIPPIHPAGTESDFRHVFSCCFSPSGAVPDSG